MNKEKNNISESSGQFLYIGRWVDKKNFRSFVYNLKNESKLTENYDQYIECIESGAWFDSIESVEIVMNEMKEEAEKVRHDLINDQIIIDDHEKYKVLHHKQEISADSKNNTAELEKKNL